MDSRDLALLLTALNRIGEELHQANVLATIGAPAPNVELPFTAYADFDPASIGAKGIAKDKSGWTQLEWGMRSFYRRRSSDDDEKGEAIRFSRCISGTVQDKNQTWETLVRFRDRKPPKRLTEEQAERMAAAHLQPTAQSKPAQPVAQPASIAAPVAPSTPAQPAGPFERWSEIRKRIPAAELPEWLMPAEGDTPAIMEQRIQALTEFAAIPAEAQAELTKLSDAHHAALAKAVELQMSLSAGLVILPPHTRSVEVGAATSTINNLIAAEQRRRKTDHAPTVTQSGAPATQPALGQGVPQTGSARTAEQLREWFAKSVKANAGQRAVDDATRRSVYLALKSVADDQKLHQILAALFGLRSYRDATSAQIYALQAWLKPSAQAKPTNPNAAAEADALALSLIPAPAATAATAAPAAPAAQEVQP